jgi:hypothetical protein
VHGKVRAVRTLARKSLRQSTGQGTRIALQTGAGMIALQVRLECVARIMVAGDGCQPLN